MEDTCNSHGRITSSSYILVMQRVTYPLKDNWKVDEDSGLHATEQIQRRVDSEDWDTHCKGYPIIKSKDIKRVKKHG